MVLSRSQESKLSKKTAAARIRAIVSDSGAVGFTEHALERMEDRDISSREVWEVLKTGSVIGTPRWSVGHDDWECRLRKTVAGRSITVMVGLDGNTRIAVLTTWD